MADYRLPFDNDAAWKLWNANWDDCVAGHGNVPAWQAYAFDFGHDSNNDGVGEAGFNVRAARSGTAKHVRSDRSVNNFESNDPNIPGEGNVVVIEHSDGTAAFYAHLLKDSVPVQEGKFVSQGTVIGLVGNTGHSSTAHLHFEVKSYFKWWNMNDDGDFGPSIPVHFEDKNHTCWRPRV